MPFLHDRVGELKVSGGIDLKFVRFSMTEALNEPFVLHVDGFSEDKDNIDFEPAIGKPVTVSLVTPERDKRFFVGLLSETSYAADAVGGFVYHLVVRPHLYFLSRRINSKVFPKKTVNEILSDIFGEHGLSFMDKTTRGYPTLEYCVQYRESDFDFASRLMEAHGISYHHKFSDGQHELHLCDTDREPMPGKAGKNRTFRRPDFATRLEQDIFEWEPRRVHTTGQVTMRDYDFINPTKDYQSSVATDAGYGHAHLDDYHPLYHHHLAEAISADYGKDYATYRLDSYRAEDHNFGATGDCPGLTPGFLMQLKEHPTDDGEYVVVRAYHTLTMQGYRSGTPSGDYQGSFVLFPTDGRPWAPPIRTPKPKVAGIETAIVVGDSEIDVDKYGRIIVQFHWNKKEEKWESMRTRVAQMWAGNLWGGQHIPRKGMEVVVTFAEGDPDRPLVIGTVYNKDNMPPYEMPGSKTVSGIKSRSTEKGTGYNELAFDDKKGSELIRMHAEKDLDSTIENDEKRTIKMGNRTTKLEMGNDSLTLDMGNIKTELKMGNMSTELLLGKYDVSCKLGPITLESMSMITLKVGTNQIIISQAGIVIQGLMITADSKTVLTTHATLVNQHLADTVAILHGNLATIPV